MGSILHILSQFDTERTYLDPQAVFDKLARGEPVPLGEPGERKWAVPQAITLVHADDADERADHPVDAVLAGGTTGSFGRR